MSDAGASLFRNWSMSVVVIGRSRYLLLFSDVLIHRDLTHVRLSFLGVVNSILSVFNRLIMKRTSLAGGSCWKLCKCSKDHAWFVKRLPMEKSMELNDLRAEAMRIKQAWEIVGYRWGDWDSPEYEAKRASLKSIGKRVQELKDE